MDIESYKPSELLGPLNDIEEKFAPDVLHAVGDIRLIQTGRRISVVGSRNVSEEGVRRTRVLVRELVANDIIVVSGLAAGVDTTAHTTAMENSGRTVAVLGTPIDQFYPVENEALQRQIMTEHVAISQFPAGCPITPKNFPMRNRTMAFLSDATIIVEAGEKSGTQHQGWEALRLGRAVFLLENIASDRRLTWPQKLINFGAEVLSRSKLEFILEELPSFTNREELAF